MKEIIVDLADKPIKTSEGTELTVGLALANCLVGGSSKDPLRSYSLGIKIKDAESLDLDKSEEEFIKTAITEFQGYNDLVKGQLLQSLTVKSQ